MIRVGSRLLAASAAVALGLGLAACGSDDDDARSDRGGSGQSRQSAPVTPVRDLPNDLGGPAPFAPDGPWNKTIETVATDPRSDEMIRIGARSPVPAEEDERLGALSNLRDSRRRLYINMTVNTWTPAVYQIGAGRAVKMVCRQVHCGRAVDAVPSELVLPDDAVPDSGHDGWLVLVDERRKLVWDLWRSRRVGQTISYAFARKWSLTASGAATQPSDKYPRVPSLRGSGLPLLAGLIRPKELRAGRIQHALAIAIPGPASSRYVAPASTTNGLSSVRSVPQGARLRLKASALARIQRAKNRQPGALTIAQTLYSYGAIVVDRAESPTLYAQRNGDYRGLLTPGALRDLRLTDFEVLTLPRATTDPDAPPKVDANSAARTGVNQ